MTEYRSYCSHDTQSRCDEKIMGLMLNYGHKGYLNSFYHLRNLISF